MQSDGLSPIKLDSPPSQPGLQSLNSPLSIFAPRVIAPTERLHLSGYTIQKRTIPKKSSRPSTAPSADDIHLLPSMPSHQMDGTSSPSCSTPESEHPRIDLQMNGIAAMHIGLEDETDATSSTATMDIPSSANDTPSTIGDDRSGSLQMSSGYDWATFIAAYAVGRWDPHRTPNPPVPERNLSPESGRLETSSKSELLKAFGTDTSKDVSFVEVPEPQPTSETNAFTEVDSVSPSVLPPAPSKPSLSRPTVGSKAPHPRLPLHLPLPSHRLRNSLSTALSTQSSGDHPLGSPSLSTPDVHATVATMRWAAARVDLSPLALPSPEHELTDPMRGVTAALPNSHSREPSIGSDWLVTPGGTRRPRLSSFWEGTTDVESSRLATIEGSPAESVVHAVDLDAATSKSTDALVDDDEAVIASPAPKIPQFPPASAPISHDMINTVAPPTDYFGDARPHVQIETFDTPENETSTSPASSTQLPLLDGGVQTLSVPAIPRRISLNRQSSSPLPVTVSKDQQLLGGRIPSDKYGKSSRAAKFEASFQNLGYLAPPYPPDELERRRALSKFNIWHTGLDLNFDRIAHLVKLVFNTKGVTISLIDEHEQWFKAEWGWKVASIPRKRSFCGHTILQRGDEPMVVLDTLNDWRFTHNPLTTGSPAIRFYAGTPLRTQDGFNIGTLAVIDDQPRDEFSPRQRHTLKEFAAIAMREMELWRDKIQLRIRDRIQLSMEQFSRECLEIDSEVNDTEATDTDRDLTPSSTMDRVYDTAAKLVKRTLDVEGVIVMDVSHCEVLESVAVESNVSIALHHGEPGIEMTRQQLSTDQCRNLMSFFERCPDGRISEGIIPQSLRPFLPTHIQYALTVPIFNIDKRPFALICAYNVNDLSARFLEGHELSYLRAIGVIILSAVLKRRMILADKAKGLFISNISHELRTPLHGILAAAELLSESPLNHSQTSFLQTVQACGTSLVETVNHVLDFTKLSGNGKAGGVEHTIVSTQVDLMQLVEEAIDGCWIGYHARSAIMGDNGIGSVYSPPKDEHGSSVATTRHRHVETVVDIGLRREGWILNCEKGGIRRVLMNVFGNSLKFTSDGYVHVTLRQLPPAEDDPPNNIKVELSVFDTGKGISQNFLKNQLFHPFSQENPLETGTGLGLAIVSSIVTSETVGGKVDVWSEENVGTEIKVTFPAEVLPKSVDSVATEMQMFRDDESGPLPTVAMIGFSNSHKGTALLDATIRTYLGSWWGFQVVDDGDIIILNEETAPIIAATERRDTSQPFIIFSSARGNPTVMLIASEHERIGGFCRILYKPSGPSRLRVLLKLSVHALAIQNSSRILPPSTALNTEAIASGDDEDRPLPSGAGSIPRRNSEEPHTRKARRPLLTPRSSTANPVPALWHLPRPSSPEEVDELDPDTPVPAITIGTGGTLLKASIGSLDPERRFRVLVVEDNSILRNLLMKWLANKGYDFRAAVDGRDGVTMFETEGPFDVVLLDLSMPILDGVGATSEIRKIEAEMTKKTSFDTRARILALTGMSSLEDKRRAFEAGVDGYLVKPVAFKTLDDMFHKLGVS